MGDLLRSRVTAVWLVLVAATVFSWEMGHGASFSGERAAGVAILLVTFVKVRFVILDFMEVRHAPWALRLAAEAWVAAIALALVVLFLVGKPS